MVLNLALERKRDYPAIHALIADSALRRTLNRHPESAEQLTLPGCLVSDAPKPFPPVLILESLDSNLGVLKKPSIMARPRQVADKLLNAGQFLNTLSELALARTLLDAKWSISLEERFYRGKDADIVARRNPESNFIDVINLAPMRLPSCGVCSRDVVQPLTDRNRIAQKLIEKFQDKFELPIQRGWIGRSWVAIDFAKNWAEDVQTFVQDLFGGNWRQEITEIVRQRCPKLTGIILFQYDPTAGPCVNRVQWILL